MIYNGSFSFPRLLLSLNAMCDVIERTDILVSQNKRMNAYTDSQYLLFIKLQIGIFNE